MDAAAPYRDFLPDNSIPRFSEARCKTAVCYGQDFLDNHQPPWLYNLVEHWFELYQEDYKGLTCDGNVKPGLFTLADAGLDAQALELSVHALLEQLSADEIKSLRFPVSCREWRGWSNPEFLIRRNGLRLEDLTEAKAQSILSILEASMSPQGYQKALGAMRVNHFLGELIDLPTIMNKYSYNFVLFGEPGDPTKLWGWSFYGHHLCLSAAFKGGDVVIGPHFVGAEPNMIDAGPWAGTRILHVEGDIGQSLMQSLTKEQQQKAQLFQKMFEPAMAPTGDLKQDRWNRDDQRHLCGAYRDNRIVPYEGVQVHDFSQAQKQMILDIISEFSIFLPDKARKRRLDLVESHFDETYFCWIGGFTDHDAFYYRIQSPVIVVEFDHHSGVFLTNTEPGRFHTHTILRIPNAGDYGQALRSADELVL